MDDPNVALLRAARHALRGVSASLAAGVLLATVSANRRALLSFNPAQLATLTHARPSRNALAIAVFVGVFRLLDGYKRAQRPLPPADDAKASMTSRKSSLVTAAVLSLACLKPASRTPLISLVATHAVSAWFQKFMAEHPQFAAFKPLDLLVFMATSGWIFLSGLFYPESYAPSHLTLIKKYSLMPDAAAIALQTQYQQGLNPTCCEVRHTGQSCSAFARHVLLGQTIAMALRLYTPVHLTTYVLACRHAAVRSRPLRSHLQHLATRLGQSAIYYIMYVFAGWTLTCSTNALGSKSLAHRKLQFWLCGAVPSLAILLEAKSRRRPIAVVLCSYAFVSVGSVLAQQKGFQWLQQGRGPARTVLEVAVVATSVAYTFGDLLDGSAVAQRMLLGQTKNPRIGRDTKDDGKLHGEAA